MPYLLELVPSDFSPVPKTVEACERTLICSYWIDKNGIAARAQAYSKKCFSEVLRGLKKVLTQVREEEDNVNIKDKIYIFLIKI